MSAEVRLAMLRMTMATLPNEAQLRVAECLGQINDLIAEHGLLGMIALDLAVAINAVEVERSALRDDGKVR